MRTRTHLLAGAALVCLTAAAASGGASAQETTTSWKGAPQFQNETLTFKVRGRIYEDLVTQEVDVKGTSVGDLSTREVRLRTARLGVEGTYNGNWAYKVELNFNGRNGSTATSGEVEWEDVYLEYKPDDNSSVMVGNYKTISLEAITSSRYISFMERGPYNDIVDANRFMSLQGKVNGLNWTSAVAVVGNSANGNDTAVGNGTTTGPTNNAKERLGYTARFTYAPVDTDTDKVHLGLDTRYRDRGTEAAFNYQARPNTNYGARYISTGPIGERDTTVAGEFAWIHNNFSVQSEYANIAVDRVAQTGSGGGGVNLKTGYLFATWSPTGEMRRYEAAKGEFNRTRILNPMTAGGWGGLELGLRYDYADLTDLPATTTYASAGKYTGVTFGATWMPFTYVRFMANYTKGKNDLRVLPVGQVSKPDVDADTLQFRAQFDW
jgi:phosphate-selective porin OprO/OprP